MRFSFPNSERNKYKLCLTGKERTEEINPLELVKMTLRLAIILKYYRIKIIINYTLTIV